MKLLFFAVILVCFQGFFRRSRAAAELSLWTNKIEPGRYGPSNGKYSKALLHEKIKKEAKNELRHAVQLDPSNDEAVNLLAKAFQ